MKRNLIKTGRQINSSPMPWPKIVAKFHTTRADGLRIGPLFKHQDILKLEIISLLVKSDPLESSNMIFLVVQKLKS